MTQPMPKRTPLQCSAKEYEVTGNIPGRKQKSRDGKRTIIVGDSEVRFCTADPKAALKGLKGGKIAKSPYLTKRQLAERNALIKEQMKGTMVTLLQEENKKAPPAPSVWGPSKPPIQKGQPTRAAGKPVDPPAEKSTPPKPNPPRK